MITNEDMNEGPQMITIPEVRVLTCSGCRYYSHQMMVSGHTPKYSSSCMKIDVFGNIVDNTSILHQSVNIENGFPIALSNCPFRKSTERDSKIEDILDKDI